MTDPSAAGAAWTIVPLAERPDLVPALARHLHAFWHETYPEKTVAWRIAALTRRCNRDRVPFALVAVDAAGDAVGTVSVFDDDLPDRPDLNPWLGTVFVRPDRRGRGLGAALVRAGEAQAARLGVPLLHLYTFDQRDLYARLGWTDRETVLHAGHPCWIMAKRLDP